ncbi:MAG TPA: hypothetical protein QGI72_01565 [Poseidonia sp.]|nr:hypothetical protein [Poseidonia sp.]
MRTASFFIFILLGAMVLPLFSPSVEAAESEDIVVCCDASEVELYLLGSDSNKQLTPFLAELGEESQSVEMQNSISSQETVGKWTLPKVWDGEVPSTEWTFSMAYVVSGAAGARINATATINIGSNSYSAQTDPGSSIIGQGKGNLVFDIQVDSSTLTSSSSVVLELTTESLLFTLPEGSDAKLEFLWGSEEDASSIVGALPIIDIMMPEPEIEGSDVYLAVKLDSPWGLSTLALAESIGLNVNGKAVTGDPIETASGDTVRVTWTWDQAAGGNETIEVEVELKFQPDKPSMTGSTTFEIETFDSNSGTGTYYPPDEPLRTNGDGSSLDVGIRMDLTNDDGGLRLQKVTTITIGDEMAFWMRWGLDHIGDENPALSTTLRAFNAGGVKDQERISRSIEPNEVGEFERQMVNLGPMYLSNGLGIKAEELLGSFAEFSSIQVELNLNGENGVVNHPVTLRFSTTEYVIGDKRMELLEDFLVVQPARLWSEFSLSLTATTSALSSLSYSELELSEELDLSVSRMPWGDKIQLEGKGLQQEEEFRLGAIPTKALPFAPMIIALLSAFGLVIAFAITMRITRQRKRSFVYFELVFVPVIGLIYMFGYNSIVIGGTIVGSALVWWITAFSSPRLSPQNARQNASTYPSIPCPACQVSNAVTTTERPHRFACAGCQRVIKLVA